MGHVFKIVINHLKRHGLDVTAPGPYAASHGYKVQLRNVIVGQIYPNAASITLIPHPWDRSISTYDLSYADPNLLPKLNPYIHKIKNCCPHCGDGGPPIICDDCRTLMEGFYITVTPSYWSK